MNPLNAQLQAFQTLISAPSASIPNTISGHIHLYQHAYAARLREALQANFPAFFAAIGDEHFEHIANQYIHAHPSTHRSIRWYGDQLTNYLTTHPQQLPHPALIDIAKMDWAIDSAFDAPNAETLTQTDLINTPPEHWSTLQFTLHPSATLLALNWDIGNTWQALAQDSNATTAPPTEDTHHLLIWREGLEPQWRRLDTLEHQLLQAIQHQENFATLCNISATMHDETQGIGFVVQYLQQWIASGILIK
jgi:Putative DNA-binding domain